MEKKVVQIGKFRTKKDALRSIENMAIVAHFKPTARGEISSIYTRGKDSMQIKKVYKPKGKEEKGKRVIFRISGYEIECILVKEERRGKLPYL